MYKVTRCTNWRHTLQFTNWPDILRRCNTICNTHDSLYVAQFDATLYDAQIDATLYHSHIDATLYDSHIDATLYDAQMDDRFYDDTMRSAELMTHSTMHKLTIDWWVALWDAGVVNTAAHCNQLQHAATHCNTLQHTATHCNTLRHTATHCNTLQHTATHCVTLYNADVVWEHIYTAVTL